jgi:rfaE bifunctional protein nucleotidyltransferase chain/domain
MTASFMKKFAHKIVSKETLKEQVGTYPRTKKVILAAGVFDIAHPGHVRHLLYAKEKADILVVNITADRFVDKGEDRPHVPEELRATNMAAFEMVDYVIIDNNKKPTDLLLFLKPDFYAKGFEYSPQNRESNIEEAEIVSQYGGEVLFTPGDVVYSSTKLINMSPPEIKYDKLISLMDNKNITFADLRDVLVRMEFKKVHVVGDIIVDTITHCTSLGAQAKTPTLSTMFENKWDFVGGAGVVSKHLKSAGANVVLTTVLGNGDLFNFVCDDLSEYKVVLKSVVDSTRPITNKNVIVVDDYRIVKVDTVDNRAINNGTLKGIKRCIKNTPTEAIIFSDFRHGIFNKRTIGSLIEAIPPGVYKAADSQVATRWGNILEFTGFDLITPNEREARFSLADQDSGIRPLASELYDSVECETLMLKLGARGVLTCCGKDHESLDSYFSVDSFADDVVDPVGAGDALLAYATLSMLVDRDPVKATILGSIAAACECELNGNVPITQQNVLEKLERIEKQVNYSP